MSRPPLPPFTHETAVQKVRMAEDGWNTRDPAKIALISLADILCYHIVSGQKCVSPTYLPYLSGNQACSGNRPGSQRDASFTGK